MPDDFYAGESIVLEAELVDRKGRAKTPQPSIGVTIQVMDEAESTTHLTEGDATLHGEYVSTSTGSNTGDTLKDTGAAWKTDEWKGYVVRITGGTGAGNERRIKSNTATVLTLDSKEPNEENGIPAGDWSPVPDATSIYKIHRSRYQRRWAVPTTLAGQGARVITRSKDATTGTSGEKKTIRFGSKAV